MIKSLISQIVNQFNPAQIILYGSFAKGTYHKYSYIDLCVVIETTSKRDTLTDLYSEIKSDLPLHIILYTPEEWAGHVQDHAALLFG